MGLLDKALTVLGLRAVEGEYREGPYPLPVSGGWLSAEAGQYANFWQMGYDVQSGGGSAMVEACIGSYAQTVAMCPGNHWKLRDNGGRERIATSALTRMLRYPNDYQSISDFLLNGTRSLMEEGNLYALVLRNARFEPTELHLMSSRECAPRVRGGWQHLLSPWRKPDHRSSDRQQHRRARKGRAARALAYSSAPAGG